MEYRQGDSVRVNLAAFIGAAQHCKESIPCEILAVDATHVDVRTQHPFREISLRIASTWIEGRSEGVPAANSPTHRSRTTDVREIAGAM